MENEDFVKWANENVIFVVGHRDDGHSPVEEDDGNGGKHKVCPLYPGLTCEQHQKAMQELIDAPEGLPKVKAPEGVPASWWVLPTGEMKEISSVDAQSAGKNEELGDEILKALGDHLPWKKYEKYSEAFHDGDEALEKGDFKAALKHYAEVDKVRKKSPEALVAQVDERLKNLNDKATAAWTEIKDGSAELKDKVKSANDLKAKLSQTLASGYLPLRAEIDAWLKANKPAK